MSGFLKKYFCFILFFIGFCFLYQLQAQQNDGSRYASNSVLADGNWYKIKIPATGVYKLTYDELKNKIGLTNPANVKIYGYGGWILDEDFTKPYVDDLPEVSVWMSNNPANFGKGDYILFYARGDIKWEYNKKIGEFEQTQNPYSSDSYYFVTESADGPSLMETQASLSSGVATTVTSVFDDYALHEQELENVGQSGRTFYGESFLTNPSQNFTFSTPGVTSDPATIHYDFISRTTLSVGTLSLSLNNTVIKQNNTSIETESAVYATAINDAVKATLQAENTINLTYKKGASTDSRLFLNYIRINYKRTLKPYDSVTLFRYVDSISSNLTYQIAEATNSILVFDVTDNTSVKRIDAQLSGSVMSFTASNASLREYAMVDIAKTVPSPVLEDKSDSRVGKVASQNLHAESGYDMVIIVQPYLREQAKKLADLHEKDSGLRSLLVNPEDIYNEFSSGKPDVTAYRRFMKMFYDRASGGDNRPKYLLLFGGGTYDNRLIKSSWTAEQRKCMLLTYQSENSLTETLSYVTDDYMGFLDDSEGSSLGSSVLDLGIGRIPVRDATAASEVVAKIQSYMEDENKGVWQNNLLFVADDLNGSAAQTNDFEFIRDAESLSTSFNTNYPDFIVNKVYEDAFPRVIEANGARYPAATAALLDQINKGVLMLNFIGHGATRSWTHENLLTYSDIEGLKNDKLPLWITATCDFSRFDSDDVSGGELAVLKRYGGAIALFSTVRVVYINYNTTMNEKISKYLLERDRDGKPLRLGDIMRNAKVEIPDNSNKLRFLLLGDPALRLRFPDETYKIEVTAMNGIDASENGINIQALDNTTIVGHIVDENGETATGFNGTLEAVIFDAEQSLRTRGNTSGGGTNDSRGTNYKAYTNTLFSGRVKVENGIFRIEFVAPKDILYTNAKGKMSFLAYDNEGVNKAQGAFSNYTVGGTNTNVPEESNGPVIEEMRLNTIPLEPYRNDIYVNTTPLFYAKVSDETGINLTNALGHNIALIIDGKTEYNLTSYFENEDDSSKKGTISFRIPEELSIGNHYLEFRVWDVWNNSTSSDIIDFVVSSDYVSSTYSFEIWGNPAQNETKFVFNTEAPGTDVSIKISAYTLTGRMVWTHEERRTADTLSQVAYSWNLNGDGGGRIIPGVYICTAEITVNGKIISMKSQKLLVSSY